MEDKWLDDIKKKLSDYEMEVPEGLWEKVSPSDKLFAGSVKSASRFKFYRYAAVMFVIAIVGGFVAHFWQEDKNLDLTAYVNQDNYSNNTDEPSTESIIKNIGQNLNPTTPAKRIRMTANLREEKILVGNNENTENPDNKNPVAETIKHDDSQENVAVTEEVNNDNSNENEIMLSLRSGDYTEAIPMKNSFMGKKSSRTYSDKLSLGVMTSTGAYGQIAYYDSGNGNIGNGVTPPNLNDPPGDNIDQSNPGPEGPPGDSDSVNRPGEDNNNYPEILDPDDDKDKDKKTTSDGKDYTHHMPVKLGLTLLYHISKKIGIETGVIYTYLYSDIKYTSGVKALYSHGEQSLHYLGIPVNLKYRPVSWKWFNVYLSGGMEFDKCINGSVKRYYVDGDSKTSPVRMFSIHERPFQFSVNASVGLQVNLNDFLGIYVEPGVSYYFKDGSSLNTIYKQRPCDFNINAGIRFSLGKY